MAQDKVLRVIFKAVDQVSDTLDDLEGADGQGGIGGLVGAINGIIGPATIAAGAILGVAAGVNELMTDWRERVLGIGDFAAVLGITTFEASALNNIAADYNITQGDMLTVMENLVKEGLEPTVEGLGQAKDLIYESEDPTDRLTTAMEDIDGFLASHPIFSSKALENDRPKTKNRHSLWGWCWPRRP